MYRPSSFREDRPEVLIPVMQEIGLACIVTPGEGELHATHAPVAVKQDGNDAITLEFHVARQNPHWRLEAVSGPSLAIFQGPQIYVHPGWYPGKREHGRVVPTWCYVSIHAHGRLERLRGDVELRRHLDELTGIHERSQAEPWKVDDAPDEHIRKLKRAIIGLRFHVERLEGAFKLNQNKQQSDRNGVIEGLSAQSDANSQRIARMMTERLAEGQ